MKKNLAKILALVMVFAMAFSLVGCGGDKDSIDGDWSGTFSGNFEGINVELDVEFTFEDGEYVMTADKDGLADSLAEYFEEMADEQGIDLDELIEQSGYADIDEAIDAAMENFEQGELEKEGEYKFDVEDEEFEIDGEEIDFDFDNFDGETLEFEIDGAEVKLER